MRAFLVSMAILLGSDALLASDRLRGRRVGIVCNPASIDASFRHIATRLAEHRDIALTAILGPQHGFRSDVQDNMIESGHARDRLRDVPVYSLYSETREPTPGMLADVDVLVVDLQDVGARVYTFIQTMALCLRACRKHGVPIVVCDRPNPIGGNQVEGPVLVEGYESFVGLFQVPMRHGMTIGELARFFNDEGGIGAALTVERMEGWQRAMYHDETGLPWVMPSPNMPTLDTAIAYPGTVLLEGTNASEGRGTTRPFEIVGAPWVDAEWLARRMAAHNLPGAYFRPVVFEPTFQKHARQTCGGCQTHVLDRRVFRPVETGVAMLAGIRDADPARFEWRQPPYEYEEVRLPIDILAGSGDLRSEIEAATPVEAIARAWQPAVDRFLRMRERFLLY